MLNATQILGEELLKLDNSEGKEAQVGYDLSLQNVEEIIGGKGMVLKNKTLLNDYIPVEMYDNNGVVGWKLTPGTYNITLHEGCKIPNNRVGVMRQRSSLLRNGTIIHSSIFDPGFETDQMGTIMIVTQTIFIEDGARVAQMYFHECAPLEDDKLYNGQFQKDKQRTK
jgi:deoxycytidine triphosphate deaminase